MYTVDNKDRVVELDEFPQSNVGAPIPMVLASEFGVLIAYYLDSTPEDWDGSTVNVMSLDSVDEQVALVEFENCYAHMFGPPNDEAFSGHPLSNRGLEPYSVFMIEESSWIRKLEKMNAVHDYHDKEKFMENKRHFVFSFHDSTFECIAEGFVMDICEGSVSSMLPAMLERLSK